MNKVLSPTAQELLTAFLNEKRALGFSYKSEEGAIRRFLSDFSEPDSGKPEFSKEYVLSHIGNKLNQKSITIHWEAGAINCFLDFVKRKGFKAYKIPLKSFPKENRNFRAYIFTDAEIERILYAADHVPYTEQNPARQYQLPVMFRILFNCGLRTSELLRNF